MIDCKIYRKRRLNQQKEGERERGKVPQTHYLGFALLISSNQS